MCTNCPDHENEETLVTCDDCGTEVSQEKITLCGHSGESVCPDCLVTCYECGTEHARNVSFEYRLNRRERNFCPDCYSNCSSCGTTLPNDELNYYEETGSSYCSCCYDDVVAEFEKEKDVCLHEFSTCPEILEYERKNIDWVFYKQPHENTTYLGIELEMGFPSHKQPQILEQAAEYLKGKHIWKHDGSINGHGAELITTPMTLQYIKKNINFRVLLQNLSDLGARSYENEQCGLHVHVSKQGISKAMVNKIKQFFITNKDKLFKFSQRQSDQFENYCDIPAHIDDFENDRYVAVNETDKTLEFRLFRGTLGYDRFKASLEFSDAIIAFVRDHSFARLLNEVSWSDFKAFIKPRYQHLFKYLNKKEI